MQTFLVSSETFYISAYALDNKRLGKQRVEGLQILRALANSDYGWQNHPAVGMWRGYESELKTYTQAMCTAWSDRGFKDTIYEKLQREFPELKYSRNKPEWLTERLVATHRGNLWLKKPTHYPPHWEADAIALPMLVCCPGKCNYYWPSHEKESK